MVDGGGIGLGKLAIELPGAGRVGVESSLELRIPAELLTLSVQSSNFVMPNFNGSAGLCGIGALRSAHEIQRIWGTVNF